jgi:acyl-CoA dehydrogenase
VSACTPPFTDEHEALRESVRGFLERELAPHAQDWEEAEWFPDEVFPRMAAQGLLGLKYPEEYGGQGGDHLHEAVLCEEMARVGSGGTAAGIGAHVNIATPPIWKFGSEEHKRRYLAPAIRGELIGALGITEPGAGSDVAALATRADRVDGGYVVNGEKTYITNGVRANFIVTAVRTTPEGGHGGISFLIVDRGEGIEAAKLKKLGWHASDTATISFQDVFVPEENLLGELHGGFKLIMANFQWERLAMALGAVGAMQIAWERTAQFARDRHAFGRPLSGHQAIRHKLADLATSVPLRHLRRAAPLRRRRGAAEGGHDGQAAHAARVVRADGRLPADPRRRRLHARAVGRARRPRRAPRTDRRRQR